MDTIGNLWWVWLIGTVVCCTVAFLNQLRRIKRMVSLSFLDDSDDDLDDLFDSFAKRIPVLFMFSLASMGFSLILLLSIVVNIVRWVQ